MKEAKLNIYQRHWRDVDQNEINVFGRKQDGLSYNYDDGLQQWDYKKHKEAEVHASKKTEKQTRAWYQEYLSFYFGCEIELCHILQGCNRSNGHSYLIFGYKKKDE